MKLIKKLEDSYVYVVHTDQKTVLLLNSHENQEMIKKGSVLALPSSEDFYQLDGLSEKELITIICSPLQLTEISTLLSSEELSPAKWIELEQVLMKRSKMDLSQEAEKPFEIVGNVRDIKMDPFLPQLQIFSGKSLLVKRYELDVKK